MNAVLASPVSSWRVEQVIVFDWHDGPRAGLCRLSQPRLDFSFELLAERATADDLDDRLFILSPLANGDFDRVLMELALFGTPTSPIWTPTLPEGAALAGAEQAIRGAIERASRPGLVVRSSDLLVFRGCWPFDDTAKATVADWFLHYGLCPMPQDRPGAPVKGISCHLPDPALTLDRDREPADWLLLASWPDKDIVVGLSRVGEWIVFKRYTFFHLSQPSSSIAGLVLLELPFSLVIQRLQAGMVATDLAPQDVDSFPVQQILQRALSSRMEYWIALAMNWLDVVLPDEPTTALLAGLQEASWLSQGLRHRIRKRLRLR